MCYVPTELRWRNPRTSLFFFTTYVSPFKFMGPSPKPEGINNLKHDHIDHIPVPPVAIAAAHVVLTRRILDEKCYPMKKIRAPWIGANGWAKLSV